MSSTPAWLPLPVPSIPGLPVLLVSVDIGSAAYTVHVTDMANMWVESLDRKAICIRGWSENTSIDPSDTPENMTKFLASLRAALDQSQPRHADTTLNLFSAPESDAGGNGLTLQITCEIPGLQPLKWPMHLKKYPSSAIATDLVLPLIQAHLTRSQEVESLIHILTQKDAVLTKSLDKLESLGTGLEHVFNPLMGRKKVTRSAAAEKVPGLAPFNHRDWKAELTDKKIGPSNTQELVNNVFGGEGLLYQPIMDVDTSPGLDKWWNEFKGIPSNVLQTYRETVTAKEKPALHQEKSADKDDEDFQVQSTPPHLKSARQISAAKERVVDDASTASEGETPEPVSPPLETRQQHQTKDPAPRLGTLGRKRQSTPAHSPSPKPISPKKQASGATNDDTETASETDDESVTASPPKRVSLPPTSPLSKATTQRGGLGRIGGPKPVRSKLDTSQQTEVGASGTKERITSSPKKLGVIGKRTDAKGSGQQEANGESSRGRTEYRDDGNVSRRSETKEGSQERADRKRQELKRELEKKAAAGPAKKKRKF